MKIDAFIECSSVLVVKMKMDAFIECRSVCASIIILGKITINLTHELLIIITCSTVFFAGYQYSKLINKYINK